MNSTMQHGTLGVRQMFEYGATEFPDAHVHTYLGPGWVASFTFGEVAARTHRLAHALAGLGVGVGDRVATFSFNHHPHLEAYFAVPSMGAVVHTLNLRLFPDQLRFVVADAEDLVIIADNLVLGMLQAVLPEATSVRHLVIVGPVLDPGVLEAIKRARPDLAVHDYEALLEAQPPDPYPWPELDETAAAMMCYTSGTTGNPKGVVYSHRSIYLHAEMSRPLYGRRAMDLLHPAADTAIIIVPMFHAAAWGAPYTCWVSGADMVMPTRFLQPAPLVEMIERFRPTMASGVPTIWNELLRYLEDHPADLSSFRSITSGGSATPRALIEAYLERYGVALISGWGMTETSPICTLALPPAGTPRDRLADYFATAGKPVPGVELRVVGEDGTALPRDGVALGEIEVRGPWITAGYYHLDDAERFHDGWLRTGDMGTIDPEGYLRISDRTKDVIKSGGEWISSIELENQLMAHPAVAEAAVIGIPDEKWVERPLALVVLREGATVTTDELRAFLASRVAKWWLPERFAFVDEIPKTSVGKFDKKVLRQRFTEGQLIVVT
ncbi:AMP-dependent synthetase and ligase [Acidimicrobium ferrooxidans DSM 10331]|uniref:AMP-dependent synthetase and ligase n=1 Tax=Acidimicrobium ferrooxidans (strain DSM 10331 / JCM 15462 / NBRC 103882 / ICP) TaxID=525909 RepID=C7LZC6_ACIFD|nr:long-chain fatty acid--CoA ligase [Acidimicrobium ferrooxidans]ACU54084.1 AMP-dependent synthetase and ligase [Acidimicrobium ferrooxidans DSM 10331]